MNAAIWALLSLLLTCGFQTLAAMLNIDGAGNYYDKEPYTALGIHALAQLLSLVVSYLIAIRVDAIESLDDEAKLISGEDDENVL